MLLAIICLVIGIVGFVKGRMNISKRKELRGGALYVVCTLLCLPLPLSFLVGMIIGAMAAANGTEPDEKTIGIASVVVVLGPIFGGIILAFAKATPKELPIDAARGFEVQPPPPPPPAN